MGDRTHIRCWIPKAVFLERQSDIEAITWDGYDLDEVERFYYTESDEVNYGGSAEIASLVKDGIPFAWQSDSGSTYGASLNIFDGKTKVEIQMDFEGAHYARVNFHKGIPVPRKDDLEELAEFAKVVQSFVKQYGIPHTGCFKEFLNE